MMFTTWGRVRGCCGHAHLTIGGAIKCLEADQSGCESQGGHSDRKIRWIWTKKDLDNYDVVYGPGDPIKGWED